MAPYSKTGLIFMIICILLAVTNFTAVESKKFVAEVEDKGPFIKDVINRGGRGGLSKDDLT